MPKVVQVDLVSFVPGPTGGQGEIVPESTEVPKEPLPETVPVPETVSVPDEQPATEPLDAPEPAPASVIKPDVSLKKKPKNLKDLLAKQEKKEKKKPKKNLKSKPAPQKKPAKKTAARNDAQIAKALDRMKQAVAQKDKAGKGGGQSFGQGEGAGTGMGKKGYDPIDLYKTVLKVAIQKNWVFNTAMARMDQDLEVTIFLKILKSGEIRDIIYETRSGNQYLDDSAKKAIQRSNPLPALPKGMASWDVLVIFTPKGLK